MPFKSGILLYLFSLIIASEMCNINKKTKTAQEFIDDLTIWAYAGIGRIYQ